MSFRKPKANRRGRQAATSGSSPPPSPPRSSSPFRPIPLEDASPVKRRAYGTRGPGRPKGNSGLIFLPGRIFTQTTRLPTGAESRLGDGSGDAVGDDPFRALADEGNLEGIFGADWGMASSKPAGEKKIRQWATWEREVIPALVGPYLSMVRMSTNLRDIPSMAGLRCTCGAEGKRKHLAIMCVYFESKSQCRDQIVFVANITYDLDIEKIELTVCVCKPAALQLLNRGLFPCAPRAPSLAVDLRLLEFVKTLFVRMAPNATAWCDALESFLHGRGYKLETRVRFVWVTEKR